MLACEAGGMLGERENVGRTSGESANGSLFFFFENGCLFLDEGLPSCRTIQRNPLFCKQAKTVRQQRTLSARIGEL